jgi:hypothetical protein
MTIATGTLPNWPTDTDHPLTRPFDPQDAHKVQHAPHRSNLLQFSTGLSLVAESMSHFVPQPDKALVRQLIGLGQAGTGALGVYHYTSKFRNDPTLHNAMGALCYGGFMAEGGLRMWESGLKHPQRTAGVAGLVDLMKALNSGVASTGPNLMASLCNLAEWADSLKGQHKGAIGALQAFTREWRTQDLAALQRNTGRIMMAIAALKSAALALQRDRAEHDTEQFGRRVEDAWHRLHGEHWEAALDEAGRRSPEALEAVTTELLASLDSATPSLPRQFAHVLEHSPGAAKALIDRHPHAATAAVVELARESPAAMERLRRRYGADAFTRE